MMKSTTTQDLALNCIFSSQNTSKSTKMPKAYIKATLCHGGSSKSENRVAKVDAAGNFNFQFNDVNVETAYLHFEVFIHRSLFPDKHVGDVNILVSELVVPGGKPSWAVYELGKGNSKGKNKGELKLSYTVSSRGEDLLPVVESSHEKSVLVSKRRVAPAIGSDIALFKTLPRYRSPLVSLSWN